MATAHEPAELCVPSPLIERRVTHREDGSPSGFAAEATICVAPVLTMLTPRWVRPGEPWPVVHPVVVALDLATDKARGVEILEQWVPPEPFVRVW